MVTTPLTGAFVPVVHAAGTDLTVLAQSFHIDPVGRLELTLGLPSGIDTATLGAGSIVSVSSHVAIADRDDYLSAVDGTLGDVDDTFDVVLDPAAGDVNVIRPSSDTLQLSVPVETDADTDLALWFDDAGVHALDIELSMNGRLVTQTHTFVNVRSPNGVGFGDMSIGLVMGQLRQPTVSVDGTVTAAAADIDELSRLADTLDAIDAVPTALGTPDATVPRAVFVEPSVIGSVATTDPELFARLTTGLEAGTVVAAPRLPFEPSAAAAAAQNDQYTKFLREGENLFAELLPRADVDRTLHVVRAPFTTEAAAIVRDTGSRLMVMDFDHYLQTEGGNRDLTDTSQLVTIGLADGTSVSTAIIDPHLSERIDHGADDPLRASIEIVADLLVVAQSIDDDGGVVSRHGMVLARSDGGVPDAELMTQLVTLLSTTDGLRLVEPADLGSDVDVLLRPGGSGEVRITLTDEPEVELDDRIALIDEISEEIYAFASMLPENDPQIAGWLQVLDAMPSTAIDDRLAEAMVDGLRDDFEVYRNGIEGPAPFTFTLTGRSNTVTFSLRNTTDTELEVRVRLSSPKITFPEGDTLWVLAPQEEREIDVKATALSNGKSSVFLRVYTPAENSDIQLMPEVVLTARVSSLAGLGRLLTGAFLLLLLTWWGRHWQQTRRKRIAAEHAGRHPSSNGNGNGEHPVDPGELAPDAAASSLPPS